MHYDGQVYRPPIEASTPLLQVTTGCSYNKCAFCTMYDRTKFSLSPRAEIEEDLDELLALHGPNLERIYLLNGDPFVLPAHQLLDISEMIRARFPRMKTITCYASIRDILMKTPEEVSQLAQAGYGDLYIGLETAYPPALEMINKGCDVEGERKALEMLTQAKMSYITILMAGIGGAGKSEPSVAATVALLNEFPPSNIAIMTTSVAPGSKLEQLRDSGAYTELTEREILQEELLYLKTLDVPQDTEFWSMHVFNLVPLHDRMANRDAMIASIEETLANTSPEFLDRVIPRGSI